jgi:hypothetical protein
VYEDEKLYHCDLSGEMTEIPPDADMPEAYRKGIVYDYIHSYLSGIRSDLNIEKCIPVLRMVAAAVQSAETGQSVTL